jgi:hypothetical protein
MKNFKNFRAENRLKDIKGPNFKAVFVRDPRDVDYYKVTLNTGKTVEVAYDKRKSGWFKILNDYDLDLTRAEDDLLYNVIIPKLGK